MTDSFKQRKYLLCMFLSEVCGSFLVYWFLNMIHYKGEELTMHISEIEQHRVLQETPRVDNVVKAKNPSVIVPPQLAALSLFQRKVMSWLSLRTVWSKASVHQRFVVVFSSPWLSPFLCLPLPLSWAAEGDNARVNDMSGWFYTTCSAGSVHNIRRLFGRDDCLL